MEWGFDRETGRDGVRESDSGSGHHGGVTDFFVQVFVECFRVDIPSQHKNSTFQSAASPTVHGRF